MCCKREQHPTYSLQPLLFFPTIFPFDYDCIHLKVSKELRLLGSSGNKAPLPTATSTLYPIPNINPTSNNITSVANLSHHRHLSSPSTRPSTGEQNSIYGGAPGASAPTRTPLGVTGASLVLSGGGGGGGRGNGGVGIGVGGGGVGDGGVDDGSSSGGVGGGGVGGGRVGGGGGLHLDGLGAAGPGGISWNAVAGGAAPGTGEGRGAEQGGWKRTVAGWGGGAGGVGTRNRGGVDSKVLLARGRGGVVIVVSSIAVILRTIWYRPSHSYNAGTGRVGFLPTRQTLCAPSAKLLEVL